MPAIIGYARTSTTDQIAGLEAQKRDLLAAGCTEVFAEQISSVAESRDGLVKAIGRLERGDALMVTKTDRLARSTAELLAIEADLTKRGIGLIVLSMGGDRVDTRNATSKLMLTILAGVATWEREIMKERQRAGIQKAQAEGKYKPTGSRSPMPQPLIDSVHRLVSENKSNDEIMAALGIKSRTLFRAKKARNSGENCGILPPAMPLAA